MPRYVCQAKRADLRLDDETFTRGFAVREVAISAAFPNGSEGFLRGVKIFAFYFVDDARSGILCAFCQINGVLGIERSPKLLDFLQ